jgi:hypothetical protein
MKLVRFVCPNNGKPGWCDICRRPCPHLYEVLAPDEKPPVCPTHRVPMVKP